MSRKAFTYRMRSGYCFVSTKRHPREPETIVCPDDVAINAMFVGFAKIDDSHCVAFRLGRKYYFQTIASAERVDLPHTVFGENDIDRTGDIPRVCVPGYKTDLVWEPPKWMQAGLQETATGYGSRLNSGFKIDFEGKLRRVYVTCYSNVGTSWFTYRGERIIIS